MTALKNTELCSIDIANEKLFEENTKDYLFHKETCCMMILFTIAENTDIFEEPSGSWCLAAALSLLLTSFILPTISSFSRTVLEPKM